MQGKPDTTCQLAYIRLSCASFYSLEEFHHTKHGPEQSCKRRQGSNMRQDKNTLFHLRYETFPPSFLRPNPGFGLGETAFLGKVGRYCNRYYDEAAKLPKEEACARGLVRALRQKEQLLPPALPA